MFNNIPEAKSLQYEDINFSNFQNVLEQFYQDGFLVIDNIFTSEEIAILKSTVDEERTKEKKNGKYDWPLHRLEAAENKVLRKLAKDSRLIKLLKPILGNDIQLQHSKLAVKLPGISKGTVEWHQDFAFFPHSNDSLVAIAISLTDITLENGGMIAIKGSHQTGLLNHRNNDNSFSEKCINEKVLLDKDRYTALCPRAGGISIHHCLTAHCSQDNMTNESRYMVVFEYRASDAYQLADGIWKDTGLQISGKPSDKVRFGGKFLKKDLEGNIILPLPRSLRFGTQFPFGNSYNQIGELAKSKSLFFQLNETVTMNDKNIQETDLLNLEIRSKM